MNKKYKFIIFITILLLILSSSLVLARTSRTASSSKSGGLGDIPEIMGSGSATIFEIFEDPNVFSIFVFILLTTLFYFMFFLAFTFIPVFNDKLPAWPFGATGTDKNPKFQTAKKIAMILAVMCSVGVLGYMSYDNYEFSAENIQIRTNILLTTFGVFAHWAIALMVGGLTWMVGRGIMKNTHRSFHTHYGTVRGRLRFGHFMMTVGITLWIGNTLSEVYDAASLGLFLAFVGVMLIIWPSN